MNWKFTHMYHPFRMEMNISLNEYAVFDIYYKSQTHPEYSVNGWADKSFAEVARFLKLGKGTVFNIVQKAVKRGLMEIDCDDPRYKRTTPLWYNYAYLEALSKEDIEIIQYRSENERSENERKSVQKMNEIVQIPNDNKVNKGQVSNIKAVVVINLETSEDVKREIKNQKIHTDSPENRILLWNIYLKWIPSESFQDQWSFYAERFPDVEVEPFMKMWVTKSNWYDAKNVRINKIQTWIKNAQRDIYRKRSNENKGTRQNKNLVSSGDAIGVIESLRKEGI